MAYKAEMAPIHSRGSLQRLHSMASCRTVARIVLVLADALVLATAFAVAYQLRFRFDVAFEVNVEGDPRQYTFLILLLIPVWIALFAFMRLYDFRELLGGTNEYAQVLNACTSGMMFVVLLSFFFPGFRISRAWLVLSWVLTTILVCCGRFLLRRAAYRLRPRGYFVSSAIIVGINHEALALAEQLQDSESSGFAILGFVTTSRRTSSHSSSARTSRLPILGDIDSLADLVSKNHIEDVIIATTSIESEQLMQLPEQLVKHPNVELRLSSGLYEIFTTGMRIATRNYVPLMSINRVRLCTSQLMAKAFLDYFLILVSLPFLIPIMLIISALIKLDSPGPVFYRRHVLGMGGEEFDALKFRTMVVNGDELLARDPALRAKLAQEHKLKDDPRVTRVGHWLRCTSLDELPQLINVLRGQMSLVGPRMITPEEKVEYGQMQFNLLTVKPGLTGLWQVSGRADLTYAERVQLDMHYIRNYNLWLDLQILFFQTPSAILRRQGAY